MTTGRHRRVMAGVLLAAAVQACAPIRGYPYDPEDTSAVMETLRPWFGADKDAAYYATTDQAIQQQCRDMIVTSRMRAFDLAFAAFKARVAGDGNAIATVGDLAALILAGLGATTGNAGTKAALAAASAGVLGAQGVIDKDLYYQRTIPALLAQMEANRDRAKLPILKGLLLPARQYPLWQAEQDLDALKAAGGIPDAIGGITQQAQAAKSDAKDALERFRNGVFAETTSAKRIQAWLFPTRDASGTPVIDDARWAQTAAWLKAQSDIPDIVRNELPGQIAMSSLPEMEAARLRLLSDKRFSIP